jgi:hypothetical protein
MGIHFVGNRRRKVAFPLIKKYATGSGNSRKKERPLSTSGLLKKLASNKV